MGVLSKMPHIDHLRMQSNFHNIAGQSYVNRTCRPGWIDRKSLPVAIVHDEGAFDGITSTVHEFGHL